MLYVCVCVCVKLLCIEAFLSSRVQILLKLLLFRFRVRPKPRFYVFFFLCCVSVSVDTKGSEQAVVIKLTPTMSSDASDIPATSATPIGGVCASALDSSESTCLPPAAATTFCYSTRPLHMVIQKKLTAVVAASRSPPRSRAPYAANRPSSGQPLAPFMVPNQPQEPHAHAEGLFEQLRPTTAPCHSSKFRQHRLTAAVSPPVTNSAQTDVSTMTSNDVLMNSDLVAETETIDNSARELGSNHRPSIMSVIVPFTDVPLEPPVQVERRSKLLVEDPAEMLSTPKARAYLDQMLNAHPMEEYSCVSTTPPGKVEESPETSLFIGSSLVPAPEKLAQGCPEDSDDREFHRTQMLDALHTAHNVGDSKASHAISLPSTPDCSAVKVLRIPAESDVAPLPKAVAVAAARTQSLVMRDRSPRSSGHTPAHWMHNIEGGGGNLLEILPLHKQDQASHSASVTRTMSLVRPVRQSVFPSDINSGVPFVDLDSQNNDSFPQASERVTMTFQVKIDARTRHSALRNAALACNTNTTPERTTSLEATQQSLSFRVESVVVNEVSLDGDADDGGAHDPYFVSVSQHSVTLSRELTSPSDPAAKRQRGSRTHIIALEGIVGFQCPTSSAVLLHVVDHVGHSPTLRHRFQETPISHMLLHCKNPNEILCAVSGSCIARLRYVKETNKKTLTIVHFNDVYNLIAREAQDSPVAGGAARFHSKLMELRRTENPLILFSGDFMGPSLMSVDMKGKQMVDFFNQCGVHYGCFGNHEFDYGLKALVEVIQGFTLGAHVFTGSTTKWIMSNMFDSQTGLPVCGASRRELFTWNNVQVGIIALCEDWIGGCSQLSPGEVLYVDMFSTGEELARELKSEGAEIVIALSHCRLPNDKEIIRRCPSIDMLLGGHDHWYKCVPGYRIVKSGEEFQYLSEIRVELTTTLPVVSFGEVSGTRMSVSGNSDASTQSRTPTVAARDFPLQPATTLSPPPNISIHVVNHPIHWDIEESPQMLKMITRYQAKLDERMGGVIGRTPVPLDPRESVCRFKEGLLSGFVCDVICTEMRAKMMHVDFAVLGGAAFSGKALIPAGPLTMGHIFDLFPNDTRVMCMRMLGKTVRRMLTVMVRECPDEMPSFPHCSADLNFVISLIGGGPAKVKDITIAGSPLEDDKMYVVGVEDFAGKGNGKYKFLKAEAELLVEEENAAQVVFWLIDYFTCKKGQSHFSTKAIEQEAQARAALEQNQKKRRGRRSRKTDSPLLMSAVSNCQPKHVMPIRQFKPVEFASTLDSATLARLYAATNLLTEDVESESNIEMLEKVVMRLLKCAAVRVYLLDHAAKQLRVLSGGDAVNSSTVSPTLPLDGTSLAGIAAYYKCVVNTKNTAKEPSFQPHVDGTASLKVYSMLTFPIYYRKTCLGVVQAINREAKPTAVVNDWGFETGPAEQTSSDESSSSSTESDEEQNSDAHEASVSRYKKRKPHFTDEDQGLALLLSKQIGMQLNFSKMFERIKRSELATTNLMEMARLLGRAQKDDSVQQMVLRITEVAKQLIGCDRCSLFLVDKGDMWTVVKSKDLTDNITIRLPIGTGVAGNTARTGTIMNIQDAYQSPFFNPETDRKTGYHTKTILAVPMMSENRESILGVLQLINKKDGSVFTQSDEELTANFVNLAAIAVHNSFEIETLRVGRDESTLQVLPVHDLTRIRFKGGWYTVKHSLHRISELKLAEKCTGSPIALDVNDIPTVATNLMLMNGKRPQFLQYTVSAHGLVNHRSNRTPATPHGTSPSGPSRASMAVAQAMMDFDDLRSDDES